MPCGNEPIVGARGTASVSRERNALIEPDNASLGRRSGIGPGGCTGCRYRDFKRNVEQVAGAGDSRRRIFADSDSR
ncbi:hypothetical protein IP88_16235 [alpha proteobacterium AAP81b]|nr:hypothetical protein IP88_16235 [alpha proteobacterium AAP81b]